MLENFTFPTSFGYDLNGRGARTGWDFTQKRAHNSSLRTPLVPKTSTRKPLTSNNTKTKARNSTTCASQVCPEVAFLAGGEIVEHGPLPQVLKESSHPDVRDLAEYAPVAAAFSR